MSNIFLSLTFTFSQIFSWTLIRFFANWRLHISHSTKSLQLIMISDAKVSQLSYCELIFLRKILESFSLLKVRIRKFRYCAARLCDNAATKDIFYILKVSVCVCVYILLLSLLAPWAYKLSFATPRGTHFKFIGVCGSLKVEVLDILSFVPRAWFWVDLIPLKLDDPDRPEALLVAWGF